ncbi:MAG: serine protease [Pseudomonadota bacterium]
MTFSFKKLLWPATLLLSVAVFSATAADLPETIRAIKPSVVAIGTLVKTRTPPVVFFGTGFVVGDGLTVVTNSHVVPAILDSEKNETLTILIERGTTYEQRPARVIANDKSHDLALLKITGDPLPALKLGDSTQAQEGQSLALTGYPMAIGLGLHAATHRAVLAAIVSITQPPPTARQLSPATINRVRDGSFAIFQLDATSYPGNSGSPLYDPGSGEVLAIINAGFIKGSKENALSNPSGISYAIPSQYIKALMQKSQND